MNLRINKWFKKQKKNNKINVKIISISKINNWFIDKNQITHESKKFFKIIGIKIKTNFYKRNWDQPIILQNEIGILGILKNITNNKYLLQAKVEPGNKNKLQFSPTVQATKSNYSQVHGGKKVPYLKFFLKVKKKYLYNQSEQGFRYFNKFNSNILLKINTKIKLNYGFIWVSLKDLCLMAKEKNLLNMDTVSVISSNISINKVDEPIKTNTEIKKWIQKKDKSFFIKSTLIPLSKLKDWKFNLKSIIHKKNWLVL